MDTELKASVATFRVYTAGSGRRTSPCNSSGERRAQAPPTRAERMAATPVTEGPLILSRLATNEMSYLQVNNFTRAVMPRSHIWRVSDTELVVPASFTNYWLITLSGPRGAVLRLDQILRCLCKYEVIGETEESLEEDVRAAEEESAKEASSREESAPVEDAQSSMEEDNTFARTPPIIVQKNGTSKRPSPSPRAFSPRPKDEDFAPEVPVPYQTNNQTRAKATSQRSPQDGCLKITEAKEASLASPPASPPLSPLSVPSLASRYAPSSPVDQSNQSDPSLHKNLKVKTQPDSVEREIVRPVRLITPPEATNVKQAGSIKQDPMPTLDLDFHKDTLDNEPSFMPEQNDDPLPQRNFPTLQKSLENHFGPRFTHPLIPSSHIARAYPSTTAYPALTPRLSLQRRELLAVGPNTLHQDVTTVGGYIGLMAVNKIFRKT